MMMMMMMMMMMSYVYLTATSSTTTISANTMNTSIIKNTTIRSDNDDGNEDVVVDCDFDVVQS